MTLRITHIIDSLGLGGAERQLLQLARYFTTKEVEQQVIYLFKEGDALVAEFERMGVHVTGMRGKHGVHHLARMLQPLTTSLKGWGPSVVSTHLPHADILGRLAAHQAGLPVISTWHSTYYQSWEHDRRLRIRLSQSLLKFLERRSQARAAHFVAVSGPVLKSYTEALRIDPSRCSVVPNSIDRRRFASVPERSGSHMAGELRLIHVGRHVRQKALDVLMRALARVPPEYSVSVDLFGSGPLTPILQRVSQSLGLTSRVRVRGAVHDILPHLAAADAFVFPSRQEGLSLAYLEALAVGLPVIASAIPSNREIDPYARATRFFESEDDAALSEALMEFAMHPELRERHAANAKALVAPFTIEAVGEQLFLLFDSIYAAREERA